MRCEAQEPTGTAKVLAAAAAESADADEGGGSGEQWMEVLHALCEGCARVTRTAAPPSGAGGGGGSRPALLCKVDHEDAVELLAQINRTAAKAARTPTIPLSHHRFAYR